MKKPKYKIGDKIEALCGGVMCIDGIRIGFPSYIYTNRPYTNIIKMVRQEDVVRKIGVSRYLKTHPKFKINQYVTFEKNDILIKGKIEEVFSRGNFYYKVRTGLGQPLIIRETCICLVKEFNNK